MKMTKILSLVLALLMIAACLTACPEKDPTPVGGEDLTGTYDITVWVSEVAKTLEDGSQVSVVSLTEQQIDAFEAANPGIVINATVEGVTEAESATKMIANVEEGADLFCFAQDQLSRLVMAGALNPLGRAASETVTNLNDAGAVAAATVGDYIYCYPITSDNGYFMYYDKSVIDEEDLDSLEALIAACEEAGRGFAFELEGSGWYNASFFFSTGCRSDWTVDSEGTFTGVKDTFNSPEGVIALKGMQKLLQSSAYVNSSKAESFSAATNAAAVLISGTWESQNAIAALGEKVGATDLPSYTVDGKEYHLYTFTGNKLMGVKPQVDDKRNAVLQKLALWLSGEECQQARFETFGWGPSNKALQATDAIKNDIFLSALNLQFAYGVPQGQISGKWWDISKEYATSAKAKDADLGAILQKYEDSISAIFSIDEDAAKAFGVVGSFEDNNWGGSATEPTDVAMTQKPEGTYYSVRALELKAGDKLKVRQGTSWDVAYGDPNSDDPDGNLVVAEDGWYFVKLVVADGAGTVTLEKTNPNIGWGVVGSFGDCNWSNDTMMELVAKGEGLGETWTATVEFEAGDEFKVRQGFDWTVDYGADSAKGGENIVISEAGTYKVTLVFDDASGVATLTYELAQ